MSEPLLEPQGAYFVGMDHGAPGTDAAGNTVYRCADGTYTVVIYGHSLEHLRRTFARLPVISEGKAQRLARDIGARYREAERRARAREPERVEPPPRQASPLVVLLALQAGRGCL